MIELVETPRKPVDIDPSWLMRVDRCPVCESASRKGLASDMHDINYNGVSGGWDFFQCGRCGSVYLDPCIDPDHIAKAYGNYETHYVAEQPSRKRGVAGFFQRVGDAYVDHRYQSRPQGLSRLLAATCYLVPWLRLERDYAMRHAKRGAAGRSVLDVGCGNGDFLARMQQAGWTVRGVDFDPDAVVTARQRGLQVSLGAANDSLNSLPQHDLVTAAHVIEHVHDLPGFVNRLYARVAPGGVLWFATPNAASPLRVLEGRYWNNWKTPRHLQMFNVASMRLLIRRVLGDDAKVVLRRRGWHVYWSMAQSRLLRRGLVRGNRPRLPAWMLPVPLLLELAALIACRFGDEFVVEIHKPIE